MNNNPGIPAVRDGNRLRVAALLNTAVPVAAIAFALAQAPLAAAIPVAAPASSQHPGVTANGDDPCFASSFGTAHSMKVPDCAGD